VEMTSSGCEARPLTVVRPSVLAGALSLPVPNCFAYRPPPASKLPICPFLTLRPSAAVFQLSLLRLTAVVYQQRRVASLSFATRRSDSRSPGRIIANFRADPAAATLHIYTALHIHCAQSQLPTSGFSSAHRSTERTGKDVGEDCRHDKYASTVN